MVSVVIPVFNRPAAVRRAIESVLAQTCQDFEVIVVDDHSTDNTAASVMACTDPRVRLIRHEQNRGGSAARNTGIQAGSAPYVAFLDSDDEWLPMKLERQLEVFARSRDRLALVYTGADRVYADGSMERHIPTRQANLARTLLTENVVGETSVGMLRRSALEAVGGFDESLPASQDLDLWLRISEQFVVEVIPDALVRVAKGDDRGRITANPAGMTRGRELFCAKHGAKMRQAGVLHRYLRRSGWVYQREVRNPRLARRHYLRSLAANPFSPLTYVLLLGACVPLSWLDMAARLKHGTFALVQPGYLAVIPRRGGSSALDQAVDKRTE
jgi:glycosyltransferase involved in cell wall biosynthesis